MESPTHSLNSRVELGTSNKCVWSTLQGFGPGPSPKLIKSLMEVLIWKEWSEFDLFFNK